MDIISKINKRQSELGLTDKELSEKTGINEYTLYYVKKYRQYLSKVGYYALCTVLGIPIVDYVDALLEENKALVGSPESNLEIAANFVDTDYLEKLEKELVSLKRLQDRVDSKNELINSQRKEIEQLSKELNDIKQRDIDIEKESYSRGIREGVAKVQQALKVEKEKEFQRAERQYKSDIKRLEGSIQKLEESYYNLYKYTAFDLKVDMSNFSIPRLMSVDEIHILNVEKEKRNE